MNLKLERQRQMTIQQNVFNFNDVEEDEIPERNIVTHP
jgi:hypothetical protein